LKEERSGGREGEAGALEREEEGRRERGREGGREGLFFACHVHHLDTHTRRTKEAL
jgi:hypothetical protein